MNLDEFTSYLEVQLNILEDKQEQKRRYEQGVKAMEQADTVARI